MAGPEIKFDLSLHLENLIPGAATVVAVWADYHDKCVNLNLRLPADSVLVGLAFLSIAYLIGVVAHVVSRLVIDTLSRLTFRWIGLIVFCKSEMPLPKPNRWVFFFSLLVGILAVGLLTGMVWSINNPRIQWLPIVPGAILLILLLITVWVWIHDHVDGILEKYESQIKEVNSSKNETVKLEVSRRRERGRLVRSAAVPAVVWAARCSDRYPWIPVILLSTLLLYSYAEVMVFQEALLAGKVEAQGTPAADTGAT